MVVLGFVMFCVAGVFTVNCANLCNKVGDKEAGYWNLGFGLLTLFVILTGIVQNWFAEGTLWWAAQVLLFSFTYVYMGIVKLTGVDGRGLGWWCLFVTANVPLPAYQTYLTGDILLTLIWIYWGLLWFLFWISMGLQKGGAKLTTVLICLMIVGLFATLWLPALYMLNGWW
ncbi:MAG: AmiS/UreI family transporter [Synergistaceae bacterium]|jgi:hypothetical protein|nr:AmiS/UreI family transporter [Synergistaceae bacterium]